MEFQGESPYRRKAVRAEGAHIAFLNNGTRQWRLSCIRNSGIISAPNMSTQMSKEAGWKKSVGVRLSGERYLKKNIKKLFGPKSAKEEFGSQKWILPNIPPTLSYWSKAVHWKGGLGANDNRFQRESVGALT